MILRRFTLEWVAYSVVCELEYHISSRRALTKSKSIHMYEKGLRFYFIIEHFDRILS